MVKNSTIESLDIEVDIGRDNQSQERDVYIYRYSIYIHR